MCGQNEHAQKYRNDHPTREYVKGNNIDRNHKLSIAQTSINCENFLKPILEKRSRCLNSSSHSVDICVYFASDYNYVIPFLIHHLSLGFEKIWLYNNDDKVAWYNHPAVLCLLSTDFVDIQPWYGDLLLHKALDHCFQERIAISYKGKDLNNVWGAVFDIDEMLVLHNHSCANSFVEAYKAPSIAVNWAFFTPEIPLTNFTRTGYLDFLENNVHDRDHKRYLPHELSLRRMTENPHIKIISRMSCYDHFVDEHSLKYKANCPFGQNVIDPQGHYFKPGPWTPWTANHYPIAQLNHYWTLSLFDFLRKIHRGKGGSYSKYGGSSRHTAEFFSHGTQKVGYVTDLSFLNYYGAFFNNLKNICPSCFSTTLFNLR